MAPDGAEKFISAGEELANHGNFVKALEQFERASMSGSGSYKAWVGRGACELQLGRFERAAESFREAGKAKPGDRAARVLESEVWRRAGQFEKELEVLD